MTSTLITGAEDFIGYHLSNRLLAEGRRVIGLDNLNDYYDVRLLKEARLRLLDSQPPFRFVKLDLLTALAWKGCSQSITSLALSIWRRRPASAS